MKLLTLLLALTAVISASATLSRLQSRSNTVHLEAREYVRLSLFANASDCAGTTYVPCPNSNVCCPTAATCIPNSPHCNIPCTTNDIRCGTCCCLPGQVCNA